MIDTHPPSISDRRVGSLDHTFALVVGGSGLYAGYESYIPYSGILCGNIVHFRIAHGPVHGGTQYPVFSGAEKGIC